MVAILEGYEQDIETGAGLPVGRGNPKVVLHTTESPRGSWAAVRNLWRGPSKWGAGLPHFLMDGRRIVQLLPLNVGAYTLENAPGGADTNRSGPAIQIEVCGYSANGWNDEEYEVLGKWLADLVKAGVPLDLAQHPEFWHAGEGIVLASYTSPIRMDAATYERFGGFCGHQHTPENAHWDPGGIDGDRLERIARSNLNQPTNGPAQPTPTPVEEDEMEPAIAYNQVNGGLYLVWFTKGRPVEKLWLKNSDEVSFWTGMWQVPVIDGWQAALLGPLPHKGGPDPLKPERPVSDPDHIEILEAVKNVPKTTVDEITKRLVA